MKHYIVKKRKKDWAIIEETKGFISKHFTEYDAWKEARRLARGVSGKATLNKDVSNDYKKKSLNLFHSRTLDCFPGQIHVGMSENHNEILEFFREASGFDDLTLPETNELSHATFYPYKGHYFFQFPQLPKGQLSLSQWAGLLAHEATHFTWYLEENIGDLFDFNIQEPQCYLVQTITQDLLDLLLDFVKENKELSFKENS